MSSQDGIIYYPSRYNPPLGHAGFDTRLTAIPSERYFDARRITFPIEEDGALQRLAIEHPGRPDSRTRFTSGRIHLEAHDGDIEEIVTFGGLVEVNVVGDETICRVTSSAPFLPLSGESMSSLVVMEGELELIMAQSRAGWGNEENAHLDRLATLEPMAIFVASIKALEERLGRLAAVEHDPGIRTALHVARDIHGQLERAGEWSSSVPGLTELL